MYITTQGIKFEIITTKEEIIFKDAIGDTLTWVNNDLNALLVEEMVAHITISMEEVA